VGIRVPPAPGPAQVVLPIGGGKRIRAFPSANSLRPPWNSAAHRVMSPVRPVAGQVFANHGFPVHQKFLPDGLVQLRGFWARYIAKLFWHKFDSLLRRRGVP
jgi:hypothetical protein